MMIRNERENDRQLQKFLKLGLDQGKRVEYSMLHIFQKLNKQCKILLKKDPNLTAKEVAT